MKQLAVVAAILVYQGKVLCMERGQGRYDYVSYKYEFPGGKIEPGEAKHTALERELREEMGLTVTVREDDLYMTVQHDYPDFSITMDAFLCPLTDPYFVCKEHVDAQWLLPEELPRLPWAPADVPIMKQLATQGFPI